MNFLDLPDDIFTHIRTFCDNHMIAALSITCKKLFNLKFEIDYDIQLKYDCDYYLWPSNYVPHVMLCMNKVNADKWITKINKMYVTNVRSRLVVDDINKVTIADLRHVNRVLVLFHALKDQQYLSDRIFDMVIYDKDHWNKVHGYYNYYNPSFQTDYRILYAEMNKIFDDGNYVVEFQPHAVELKKDDNNMQLGQFKWLSL
jgi:hypothetical protein